MIDTIIPHRSHFPSNCEPVTNKWDIHSSVFDYTPQRTASRGVAGRGFVSAGHFSRGSSDPGFISRGTEARRKHCFSPQRPTCLTLNRLDIWASRTIQTLHVVLRKG